MIIAVYRGDGLRSGTPIVEPLLSNDALMVRGKAEMNQNAHQTNHLTLSVVPLAGARLGQLVESVDVLSAVHVRSKVTGISIRITEADVSMSLNLEQPV